MNNEPVAWMSNGKEFYVQKNYCSDFIPLYTHPVNTCKHGVDDGACKECYIEVTPPAELTDEFRIKELEAEIERLQDQLNEFLVARDLAILRKASEK